MKVREVFQDNERLN